MGSSGGISGKVVWLDGDFVPWDAANVHILTHTLHYGLGVFEGLRCYGTDAGRSVVFRLPEHVRRLLESAHINLLEVSQAQEEIEEEEGQDAPEPDVWPQRLGALAALCLTRRPHDLVDTRRDAVGIRFERHTVGRC